MLIGICDNDPIICQSIRKNIEQTLTNAPYQLYEYTSGIDLLQSNVTFDILFLDIELDEDLNGLEIAQQLEKINPELILIFISSYTKYVSSSFYFHTFQFLLKPIDPLLLQKELLRAVDQYLNDHAIYAFQQYGAEYHIEVQNIVYIESQNRKLILTLNDNNTYEVYAKLTNEENFFFMHNFAKTHRSYLVNLKYISEIKKNHLILRDQTTLPISRTYLQSVQNKYHQYLLGRK